VLMATTVWPPLTEGVAADLCLRLIDFAAQFPSANVRKAATHSW